MAEIVRRACSERERRAAPSRRLARQVADRRPTRRWRCADATASHRANLPVHDRQVRGGTLQPRRGETEECLARRRGRLTNGRASACQPCAPTRAAGVRTSRRVAVDHGNPRRIDAELLGRHLRYRDAHAGADVHFARVDRDRAIRIDRQGAVDFLGIERSTVAGERARRRLLAERRQPAEGEADDEPGRRLQPVAPIHQLGHRRGSGGVSHADSRNIRRRELRRLHRLERLWYLGRLLIRTLAAERPTHDEESDRRDRHRGHADRRGLPFGNTSHPHAAGVRSVAAVSAGADTARQPPLGARQRGVPRARRCRPIVRPLRASRPQQAATSRARGRSCSTRMRR